MAKGTFALSTNATRSRRSSTNATRSCRIAHLRHPVTRQKKKEMLLSASNYVLVSTMIQGSRGQKIKSCSSPNLLMWSSFRPRAEASRFGASKAGTQMRFTLMWLSQGVLENTSGEVKLAMRKFVKAQAVVVILLIKVTNILFGAKVLLQGRRFDAFCAD